MFLTYWRAGNRTLRCLANLRALQLSKLYHCSFTISPGTLCYISHFCSTPLSPDNVQTLQLGTEDPSGSGPCWPLQATSHFSILISCVAAMLNYFSYPCLGMYFHASLPLSQLVHLPWMSFSFLLTSPLGPASQWGSSWFPLYKEVTPSFGSHSTIYLSH